jgi:hypothetical protein
MSSVEAIKKQPFSEMAGYFMRVLINDLVSIEQLEKRMREEPRLR